MKNNNTHLLKHQIITESEKLKQAEWILKTIALGGKPICRECYTQLKAQGYITLNNQLKVS